MNLRGLIVSRTVFGKRMKALRAIVATICMYLAPGGLESTLVNAHRKRLQRDENAYGAIMAIGAGALAIIGVMLTAVVGLRVAASLFPTYTSSVGSISENFTTADWGDPTANDISPIFALVVSLAGLVGVAALVLSAILLRGRKAA